MNILQALTAVALLVLGTGRTIVFLLPSLIMKKPVRLDLPIPGFEIDIVFVSDDKSAKVSVPAPDQGAQLALGQTPSGERCCKLCGEPGRIHICVF